MSKTLVLTVLFLFALLFLIVARWKDVLWLWKTTWGKITFIALLCAFVFFNIMDIANKTISGDPSLQTILDSLNVKDKRTAGQMAQLAAKMESHNDSILNDYKKFGPPPSADTASINPSAPLALSNVPQVLYLSDYDVALVVTIANNSDKPAYIGNFKSFQVDIIDSLVSGGASIPKDAIKETTDKSVIRIGKVKELPAFISNYQIIVFVHSTVKVHSLEKNTLLYITSLTGKDYCDGQSLTLYWDSSGMYEKRELTEGVCSYLNEHLGAAR